MRTAKGSGLLAAVLTLVHGLYIPLRFLWILLLIPIGLSQHDPSLPENLALAVLDTVVYLFLGVVMLRGRRDFFIYTTLWTVLGAFIATAGSSYKDSILNFLSLAVIFLCIHYYVGISSVRQPLAKQAGLLAGVLALAQGIITSLGMLFYGIRTWIIVSPPYPRLVSTPPLIALAVTAAVYLILGVGMIRKKKEFFLLAIFWVLIESVLAIASPFFMNTHYYIISLLTLTCSAYYYYAKTRTR